MDDQDRDRNFDRRMPRSGDSRHGGDYNGEDEEEHSSLSVRRYDHERHSSAAAAIGAALSPLQQNMSMFGRQEIQQQDMTPLLSTALMTLQNQLANNVASFLLSGTQALQNQIGSQFSVPSPAPNPPPQDANIFNVDPIPSFQSLSGPPPLDDLSGDAEPSDVVAVDPGSRASIDDDASAIPNRTRSEYVERKREREIAGRFAPPPDPTSDWQAPCRRRGMSSGHNIKTAFFTITENTQHGEDLHCSYAECRKDGPRFRFCAACQAPVALGNFTTRHNHHPDEFEALKFQGNAVLPVATLAGTSGDQEHHEVAAEQYLQSQTGTKQWSIEAIKAARRKNERVARNKEHPDYTESLLFYPESDEDEKPKSKKRQKKKSKVELEEDEEYSE